MTNFFSYYDKFVDEIDVFLFRKNNLCDSSYECEHIFVGKTLQTDIII